MLFNSIEFFLFFPLFFLLYFSSSGKVRTILCLFASYFFYAWWDPRFIPLILSLTLLNFFCGQQISKNKKFKKFYLKLSIILSLGTLGIFKYFNFFIENIRNTANYFGLSLETSSSFSIILPVGISFYTFQTMSYTIDLYENRIKDDKHSLLHFATYVAFFPQLVAGPIVRASDFLPQLHTDQKFNESNFFKGLTHIIWGYFLKISLADSLALVIDTRFAHPSLHTSLSLIISTIFYSFQIYGDFAGYSLIAIGLAKMLGFHFEDNFKRPYFSQNFSEFWQRWHISLSSWLKDYLYIPLGGNKKGTSRTYINLMITMLLGGLWHGANWTFVIWGFLHGSFLVLQRLSGLSFLSSSISIIFDCFPQFLIKFIKITSTFFLTSFAWIFFRSENYSKSCQFISQIILNKNFHFMALEHKFHVIKGLALIFFVLLIDLFIEIRDKKSRSIPKEKGINKRTSFLNLIFCSIIIVLIFLTGTFKSNSFIYFQF